MASGKPGAVHNADFEVAKGIKPSIADEFSKVGVQAGGRFSFWR